MGRITVFELPVDSSLFTPLQLQPRAVLWTAMTGWARWLGEHWRTSFPGLLTEEGLGVVVAGFDVDYRQPFTFLDSDTLVVTVGMRVREDGALLFIDTQIAGAAGDEVVRVTGVLRPVWLAEPTALTAASGNLSAGLFCRFAEDEIVPRGIRRTVPEAATRLEESGHPVAESSHIFTVHRHHCEAADQWSALEMPNFAATVREELLSEASRIAALAGALGLPLRRLSAELRRAAFFLDRLTVECRAFLDDGSLTFLYRFHTNGETPSATVIEYF